MDYVIHDGNLASIKTSNVREFLYNNIRKIAPVYQHIYLWLSHREYNIDFVVENLEPKRLFPERENFIYEVVFDNNYIEVINDISNGYDEFQFWEVCFTNMEIKEFRLCDYPATPGKYHKDGFAFYKGIENNVVWIEKDNVEEGIVDFI